jgi:hypothetical protein
MDRKIAVLIEKNLRRAIEGVKDLQFAVRNEFGYEFLPYSDERQVRLEKICQETLRAVPQATYGQIQDTLARLVNG